MTEIARLLGDEMFLPCRFFTFLLLGVEWKIFVFHQFSVNWTMLDERSNMKIKTIHGKHKWKYCPRIYWNRAIRWRPTQWHRVRVLVCMWVNIIFVWIDIRGIELIYSSKGKHWTAWNMVVDFVVFVYTVLLCVCICALYSSSALIVPTTTASLTHANTCTRIYTHTHRCEKNGLVRTHFHTYIFVYTSHTLTVIL